MYFEKSDFTHFLPGNFPLHYIVYLYSLDTKGHLFSQGITVLWLSYFQFTQRFYVNTIYRWTTSSPHFFSGIVERAKRERAWKSPHARKARRVGEREKVVCYLPTPLLSLFLQAKQPRRKLVSGFSFTCNKHPPQFTDDKSNDWAQWEKESHWMRLIDLEGDGNFTLQNQSAVKGRKLGLCL